MNLNDYQAKTVRHILVYGPPKCGKTAAIGALASHFTLHYFDLEDGIKTLLNPELLKPEFRANINLFSLPDKQTNPIAIETLLKVLAGGKREICHQHGKVSCPSCKGKPASTIDVLALDPAKDIVVIDSYSQLAESSMNWIMRDAIMKENYDAKPGWDEYGKQGRILERIGSAIQVAPFNVIVASHEMMVEMEDKEKKIVPIGGTSNASKVFAKYFDDVVYLELVNKRHRMISSTMGKTNVLAGSRAGITLGPDDTLLKLFGR